jgi:hypothetical protein
MLQSRIAAIDVELQNINVRQMTHAAMKPQLESAVEGSQGRIGDSLNPAKLQWR